MSLSQSASADVLATGPTTLSQDLLAAALAALLPLGGGLLVLLGFAWWEEFGAVLGTIGALSWGFWWRKKHQAFFPKDLRGASVGGIAFLVALVGLLFVLAL